MSEEQQPVFDTDKLNAQLSALNKVYNTGIDDAIKIVQRMQLSSSLGSPIQSPLSSTYQPYSKIISQLMRLKKP